MKKYLLLVVVLGVVGVLGMAVLNMVMGLPLSESYKNIECTTPEMELAKAAIGAKCIMCHCRNPELPFYAKMPVASSQIGKHIENGTKICDLQALLEAGGKDEVLLAKLEQSIKLDNMPIREFLLMHWNGKLSEKEKSDIITWIHQVREAEFSTGLAAPEFANLSVQPLPDEWPEPLNEDKVKLGDLLYHDTRLSGDDTISCASCHDLKKGGTDQAQFSTGVRDQVGGINAPTTLNAMFNFVQFWDGRAKDLADQAGGPPLNPIEMDTNWEQVVGKLSKDAELTALHKTVYGNGDWSDKTITEAIAEFEKTLITPNSALDNYLKGHSDALTTAEKEGFALLDGHSCTTCHAGKAMGGQSFEKPVDPVAYYEFRGIEPGDAELGRYNVTKNEEDRFKLKVPLLRNLAVTFPYLHDGNISDLKEIVPIMNDYFVPELNRKPLSDADRDKIVAVLMKN